MNRKIPSPKIALYGTKTRMHYGIHKSDLMTNREWLIKISENIEFPRNLKDVFYMNV